MSYADGRKKVHPHKVSDYESWADYESGLAKFSAEDRLEQRKASVARKIAWREAGPEPLLTSAQA
jgi:hypothetical protein